MLDSLSLIGRKTKLFDEDVNSCEAELLSAVSHSSFLVLGAAGSIGQAVTKEIFKRSPRKLHVVDISENNLVELVRDLRSSIGYIKGDFKTFALDIGSKEYDAFIASDGQYDYVLNLSALKHVRSERDPFTLMRMIKVNIFNSEKSLQQAIEGGARKYFCVSTDKAANPVNMMGATKRIMEMFIRQNSDEINVSMARFANVAFSDGSLLHGFTQRLHKRQPISAPNDVLRYFLTPEESGELCLLSCIFGSDGDIFFPKLNDKLHLIKFSEIALNFLRQHGYAAYECSNEDEARQAIRYQPENGKWPCLFLESDTTGEKPFEEFYTETETVDTESYSGIGIVMSPAPCNGENLKAFKRKVQQLEGSGQWSKQQLLELFTELIPDFHHKELGKSLDSKM